MASEPLAVVLRVLALTGGGRATFVVAPPMPAEEAARVSQEMSADLVDISKRCGVVDRTNGADLGPLPEFMQGLGIEGIGHVPMTFGESGSRIATPEAPRIVIPKVR